MRAKKVQATTLGMLTMLMAASAHGFELFSADRYDEMAALPVFSLGAPTGMVASWGSVFVGFGGLATETAGVSRTDASSSVGMGLGDPIKSIGATISLSIGSVAPDGGLAERGSFGALVGKFFVGPQLGVAVGGIDLAGWNDITVKRDHSFYIAATKIIPFDEYPVIVSLGAGNNAFADVQSTNPDPKDEIDLFAAIAFYLTPHINLIADYTAGVSSLGTSIAPLADAPLVITLAAHDLSKDAPGRTSVAFVGSIAYAFRF